MASMTTDFGHAVPVRRRGFFSRLFDAMIEARAHEAQRRVNGYLLTLNDDTLTELGYDRAKLMRKGTAPMR